MNELFVFGVTFVATVLSSMSGGGTGIIILPAYLSLGLSYPLILATSDISATFWVLVGSFNYLKGRKIDWPFIIIFSLIGLVGSYFAVLTVIAINQRLLGMIAGCIILVLVMYTFFQKDLGLKERRKYPRWRQMLAYPFALFNGFYENFFGAGNGIAFSLLTFYTKGFDFVDALGHYYAISFSWCLFGFILLASKGYFDFKIMNMAILGSVLGAWVGSRYGRYKGNKFIKLAFLVIGGVLGLKLLLGL